MPRAHPQQPLTICCELCDARIPSSRIKAWYEAIDHALDFHRATLLATPEYARRYFRVTNPATGKPARLTHTTPPS